MSSSATSTRSARHRDSPRTRRLAREAGVDLTTVARTGAHGRATARDVAGATGRGAVASSPAPGVPAPVAPAPAPVPVPAPVPAAEVTCGQVDGGPSAVSGQVSSLLEVDVTSFLRGAADEGPVASRTRLLAAAVGSLARAVSTLRPPGLPPGPVDVGVRDDAGRTVTVVGADHLSTTGVVGRLSGTTSGTATGAGTPAGTAPAAPAATGASAAALHVVGTGRSAATAQVLGVPAGALAVLAVGPVVRRPVVVVSDDGQEGLAVRSVVWLALSTADALAPEHADALLVRLRDDLALRPAVDR